MDTSKIGAPPGTLAYTGTELTESAEVQYFSYHGEEFNFSNTIQISKLNLAEDLDKTHWLNIDAVADVDLVKIIGKKFSLNSMLLEDILTVDQLPKIEVIDHQLVLSFKMLHWDYDKSMIDVEQVSLVLVNNFVLSFQERKGDVFDIIRERIRKQLGNVRRKKADYLVYALLDVAVDHYYIIVDRLNELISELELKLVDNPAKEDVQQIVKYQRELIQLRKYVNPLREALYTIGKEDFESIDQSTKSYFSDVLDHLNHVAGQIDTNREVLAGLLNLHHTNMSNSLNSVMKTLTLISTIFIPLTFIAGIYGMNFTNMPELNAPNGYPIAIGGMVIVGVVMYIYMKRKNWF